MVKQLVELQQGARRRTRAPVGTWPVILGTALLLLLVLPVVNGSPPAPTGQNAVGSAAGSGADGAAVPPPEATERVVGEVQRRLDALLSSGLWLSPDEIAELPTSGAAWERVLAAADARRRPKDANLAARNTHATQVLAAALVAARLDSDERRAEVRDALVTVISDPPRKDLLAAARRLGTYVIAADLIQLERFDPGIDNRFRSWLGEMLALPYRADADRTVRDVHELRPNNWGTDAGASRIAVAAYLDDEAELERAARVFKGWLGDRESHDDFVFGRGSWQADPDRPVAVNPVGATLDGHPVDGVLPDDQRRAGRFRWPPPKENYVWGALQGAVAQAELLSRQGYDAWNWEDRALLRAVTWLHEQADYPAEGDDVWVAWLVNDAYGTAFPAGATIVGERYGFTDWTHASSGRGP